MISMLVFLSDWSKTIRRKKIYPDISINDQCLEVDELRRKRISLDIRGKESTDLWTNKSQDKLSAFFLAVSHIPQFGDANTSPVGDAASHAGYADMSARDAHL